MHKLLKLFVFGFLVAGLYTSCEDDLEELDPNRVVAENFFQNEGEIEAAVLSGYTTLRSNQLAGRFWFFLHDIRDDHHTGTSALFGEAQRVDDGDTDPSNGFTAGIWNNLYIIIHRMNTALAGMEDNESVSADAIRPLEAEARFLRGWAYGELATLYGDAPIRTSPVETADDELPRSPVADVWALVNEDLAFAVENLPEQRNEANLGRATSWSARGIYARYLMQQNDLAGARPLLEAIVDSDAYSLVDDYGSLFTEENGFLSETLWEVVFEPQGGFNWNAAGDGTNLASVRAQEYGPTWRNVSPTTKFIGEFENAEAGDSDTDPRFRENVILDGATYLDGVETLNISRNGAPIMYLGEETYANWYKYGVYYKRNPEGFVLTGHNLLMFRLADAILLLAEIEAREGNLDEARRLMNIVRDRAGVVPIEESSIPNGSQQELIYAVQHERIVELATEQVRDRDLQRYKAAGLLRPEDDDLAIFNQNPNGYLPVPQEEIDANPMISSDNQNEGY